MLILYMFFVTNVSAQIAQTEDEVKKLMFTSNLEKIVEIQGNKGQDLGVNAIRKILTQHEDALVGDISELSKFATLQELCSKIEVLPERQQLGGELFELFKKLSVLEGEPKNWNEVLVKGEGGALGLITRCLMESAGADLKSKVVDYLMKKKEKAPAGIAPSLPALVVRGAVVGPRWSSLAARFAPTPIAPLGHSLRCVGGRPSAAPAVTIVPDAAANPSSRCFRSTSSLCCLLAGRARSLRRVVTGRALPAPSAIL